jgi:hypothetical protein
MLIHLPVALPPVVELAGGDVEPPNEPPGTDLGLLLLSPVRNDRNSADSVDEPLAGMRYALYNSF